MEIFGILGMSATSFLLNRMFEVMDQDHDGMVEPIEYLMYMDILLHGTEEEKYKQSFKLLDVKGEGKIYFVDLKKVTMNLT